MYHVIVTGFFSCFILALGVGLCDNVGFTITIIAIVSGSYLLNGFNIFHLHSNRTYGVC